MTFRTRKNVNGHSSARSRGGLVLLCAAWFSIPVAAQDSSDADTLAVPGDGFVDTMRPAVPGAQEVIIDVPNPFFWSRYQTGQIGEWTYTVFPDGSGTVSNGDRAARESYRLICIEAVSCDIRSGGRPTITVPATGAPAPSPPTEQTGEAVSRYLAEWILAGTGAPTVEDPAPETPPTAPP